MNGYQPSHEVGALEDIERSMRECRRWADNADEKAEDLLRQAQTARETARAYRAKADAFDDILRLAAK